VAIREKINNEVKIISRELAKIDFSPSNKEKKTLSADTRNGQTLSTMDKVHA
jgi:hypothetical protein